MKNGAKLDVQAHHLVLEIRSWHGGLSERPGREEVIQAHCSHRLYTLLHCSVWPVRLVLSLPLRVLSR